LKILPTLKNKKTFILTLLFFLIVNTRYFWEVKLGIFVLPAIILLFVAYVGIGIGLIFQVFYLIKEKGTEKSRLINSFALLCVLSLTYWKPFGLINFEEWESDVILVAKREGAANCMTTLKLKKDFTFSEKISCFGVSETTGKFRIQRDTIYFEHVNFERGQHKYYQFATIISDETDPQSNLFCIKLFKNVEDSIGKELRITYTKINLNL
jgi:hypothetical protein